ncbi:MATE family efflux transporter [Arenicella xantha]|uniref:Multidrug-efflux transporter n=1 Tax=Arenicella xantha TaxID=644221 RepID=A0A395JMF1_9GAMM|nr:MATE family efflux transporter [Arenicella xantha]RBP52800.1 MATE family multidrug resistance protein [Arenicella xantha]
MTSYHWATLSSVPWYHMNRFVTEINSLIKLAAPVSLAQLCLVGMTATDVLFAGQAGTTDLAGMNLGANTWSLIIYFFMGVGFATQPLVAKHYGARDEAGIKHQIHQSMWMCFALGIIATLVVWVSAWAIQFIRFDPDLLSIAQQYLMAISLCAIPITMIPALRGALEGMSLTREVFLVNFGAFLLNIPMDYVLVNGLYGLPKLGGVGCAWSTVGLMWLVFLASSVVVSQHHKLRDKKLLKNFERPNIPTIVRTLKMGVPMGASLLIELSMFAGAGMMIAMFGVIQAGAHAVAITVASMSFMLYMGIGQGVTIRASQFLGAGRADDAWYSVRAGTIFNLMVAIAICIAFVLFTEPLIRLFSDDPDVIQLAIVLLYFGAAFQVADSLQIAAICGLRAYHDTQSPPKYQFISFSLVGLPLGVGTAFYGWWPGLEGAKGMWFAMVVSLSLVGLLLLWRLATRVRDTAV